MFPNDKSPKAINLLAWQIFKDFRSGIKTYEFTFQYEYPTRLVKVHVVLESERQQTLCPSRGRPNLY